MPLDSGLEAVGLWAAGDPRSSQTWSGTPKALANALEAAGIVVHTGSGQVELPLYNLMYAPISVALGQSSRRFRHFWGPIHRRNVEVWSQFRATWPTLPVIHTDHMWLNPSEVGEFDYLYRDSGWSQWARQRGLSDRLTKRIGGQYAETLQEAKGVFVTSEWAGSQLVDDGADPTRVHVVGTGVGNLIQPFFGKKDYENGKVLSVAKVRPYDKGVDLLLEAFKILAAEKKPWTLDLVVSELPRATSANVRLHTALPSAELISLFQASSLFAMPARNEPFGLVYLEAQLSRTPILGSRLGAFPELSGYGERGFALHELDPHTIAAAIDEALSNPSNLAIMGNRAVAYASEVSWERTSQRIMDIIRR